MTDVFFEIQTLTDCLKKCCNEEIKDDFEIQSIKACIISVINSIKPVEITKVKQLAERFYILNNISEQDFYRKDSRKREILEPRQAFAFLAHKIYGRTEDNLKGFTQKQIGQEINRDHATIIHSCKVVFIQFRYYKKYLIFWQQEIEAKTNLRF